MSFTGDGKTPSALSLYERQGRQAKGARTQASGTANGEVSYAVPLTLPPAILQPSVSLNYSSGSGDHSVLGRGWQLDFGPTIRAPSPRSLGHVWADVPGVLRVQGGGLDGLLVPDGSDWRWVTDTPGVHVVAWQAAGVWVLQNDGRAWILENHRSLEADAWYPSRVTDIHQNQITYHWDTGLLDQITYGANGAGQPLVTVDLDYTARNHTSFRASGGMVDVVADRLDAVTVHTDGGTYAYQLPASTGQLDAVHWVSGAQTRTLASFAYTPVLLHQYDRAIASANLNNPPFIRDVSTVVEGGDDGNSETYTMRGLYDLSGDGLPDLLDLWELGRQIHDYAGHTRTNWGTGELLDLAWDPLGTGVPIIHEPNARLDMTQTVLVEEIDNGELQPVKVWGVYQQNRLIDLDGDGFLDLVVHDIQPADSTDQVADPWAENLAPPAGTDIAWTVTYGTNRGFELDSVREGAPFRWSRIGRSEALPQVHKSELLPAYPIDRDFVVDLVDMNGDGFLDILGVDHDGIQGSAQVWYHGGSRGSGWDQYGAGSALTNGIYAALSHSDTSPWQVGEVNRTASYNGPNGYNQATPSFSFILGYKSLMDINGDGLTDLIDASNWDDQRADGTDQVWRVYLGNGLDFQPQALSWPRPPGPSERELRGPATRAFLCL